MMSLGDSAAKLNLPVFPCAANKRPVTENGFKNATTNPAHIVAAFERPGAALIGVPTGAASGFIVIDVDIKNGREGAAWLDENREALPQTRTHKTQSGGLHLLFRCPEGVEIRNSQSRVAPGVDVRGEGGYIIAPPSPGYTLADDTEPADMPRWLIKACLPPPMPERPVLADTSREIASKRIDGFVRSVLDRVRTAPDGSKHETLRNAALALGGIQVASGLSDAAAINMLVSALPASVEDWRLAKATAAWGLEHGRERPLQFEDRPLYRPSPAEPPAWLNDDLPDGAYGDIPRDEHGEKATETRQNAPLPLLWFDEIEPVLDVKDFVQGVLIEQGAAVVYGESNAGKTFWTTDLALHVAAGDSWCGKRVEQGGVVYCVLEGGIGFRNRVAAWKKARGLEGHPIPFVAIPSGLNLLNPAADTPKLIEAIKAAALWMGVPVKLVVIDTLSRALAGGNENAPEDMGALVMNMDTIRTDTEAAVLFVHHCGKDQAKGARGHSSLRAAIDTEIEVIADEESDAKTATIVKQRDLPKGDHFNFKLKVVELGQNRHGEAVTTCTVDYGDKSAKPVTRTATRNGGGGNHQQRALEILADLIATSGQTGFGVPHGIPSVPDQWWRERFYERAMAGAEQDTKKRAFRRAADSLVERHQVGLANGRVWLGKKSSEEENMS